jgi:pimeloyl-ACP methyl ester carboxylesterase
LTAESELRVEHANKELLDAVGIQPKRRYTEIGSMRIHSLELGEGRPVVLIHGGSGGGANWYRLLGPLGRRFRVIAPDLPGFGLSSPAIPAGRLGDQAAELLHAWGRNVVAGPLDVIGTSFGGLAAFRMAQLDPPAVRSLVLMDSIGLGPHVPAVVRLAVLPGVRRVLLRPTRAGTEWLFRHYLVADAAVIEARERAALVNYLFESARSSATTVLHSVPRFAGLTGQREVFTDAELRARQHRTLVVWGERDGFLPVAHAERAASLMPRSSLVVIRGAGHSPNWETPGTVTDSILRFLTESPGA